MEPIPAHREIAEAEARLEWLLAKVHGESLRRGSALTMRASSEGRAAKSLQAHGARRSNSTSRSRRAPRSARPERGSRCTTTASTGGGSPTATLVRCCMSGTRNAGGESRDSPTGHARPGHCRWRGSQRWRSGRDWSSEARYATSTTWASSPTSSRATSPKGRRTESPVPDSKRRARQTGGRRITAWTRCSAPCASRRRGRTGVRAASAALAHIEGAQNGRWMNHSQAATELGEAALREPGGTWNTRRMGNQVHVAWRKPDGETAWEAIIESESRARRLPVQAVGAMRRCGRGDRRCCAGGRRAVTDDDAPTRDAGARLNGCSREP